MTVPDAARPRAVQFGTVVTRLVVATGLWVVGLSLAAAVLGGLGWWTPWVGLPVAATLAGGTAYLSFRLPLPGPAAPAGPTTVLVAIALAFAAWAGATHAEQLLPRRDSASNLQAALSLARTHTRVVPVDATALGGPDVLAIPGVTLASPAFYAIGGADAPAIQPQFVVGPAAVYGLGDWLGGLTTMLVLPALAGALAILAFGLLVGRLAGPWWGVLGAGLVVPAFPLLHVARSTYSEPLALVTLGAGLLALAVAADRHADPATARRWAWWSGVLVGGTTLVRIDGLREVVLLLVVAGLGAAQGRPWPRALILGTAASTGLALAAALALSNQYLGSIARSLVPLLGLGAVVGVVTWLGLLAQRRGSGLPRRYAVRLPVALSVTVAGVLVLLATRPLWLVVRQDPSDPGARYVAGMQARQGLPVDGGRTYAEHTITWLTWWLGPVTLVVAAVVLVTLVHRLARHWIAGELLPAWAGPVLVAAGSTALTLWRPGITPDHPWAERRLVIAVPFAVALAVVGVAWLARGAVLPIGGGRRVDDRVARALAVVVAAGIVVPMGLATWPHMATRVEAGERAAVEHVCRSLAPGDVVLMVDARAANEWVQVVRGQCDRAALSTTAALRKDPAALAAAVERVGAAVRGTGGTLRLLSADETTPALPGTDWDTVVDVVVHESQHVLEQRPDRLDPLPVRVRLATP